jgi:DNA polymerase III delta subunit
MNETKVIGKIAADKDSKKLGRIVKIVEAAEKPNKAPQPYAVIRAKRFLRKDVVVLIELSKLIEAKGDYAWFDITKEEFKQEEYETRALMELYG